MAKSFKKVIACLLAVLMVLFSVPFTALANPTDLTPDVDIRFGTLTRDYLDYTPDFSSGQIAPEGSALDSCNFKDGGIYGPTLDYTGGVNEETGALEVTGLSVDVEKTATEVMLYNEDIEDPSEFAEMYEGEPQVVYEEGMGFTMTFSVKNVDQLATLTGYFTYSDNIEPVYVYNSGATAKKAKTLIGSKAAYDADTTKQKKLLFSGKVTDMDANNFYGDFNTADHTTIADGEIFLGGASDTGEAVPMASYDSVNGDDSVVDPKTGLLGYDFDNNSILITFAFLITGEISEANPLVIGFSDEKAGGYTGETCLECAYTGNDLNDEDHSRYATSPTPALSNTMYFMGYNANSKQYLYGGEEKEHKHTYDTAYTEPTCTENGYTTYTCNNEDGLGEDADDDYKVYDDPATTLGHDIVVDEAVPATCTETGLKAGSHCSRCDDATVEQEVIPELGHDYPDEWTVVTEATEEAEGLEKKECSRCDSVITQAIPKKEHVHNFVKGDVVAPTCTKGGYTVYTCACGETENRDATEALGHDIVDDAAVAATCTKTGLTAGSHCSRCDDATVAQTVVDALGHDMVTDEAVAATCTQTGLTAGEHCSRCDDATVAQTVVDALGHDYPDEWTVVTPATEDNDGLKKRECSRCDSVEEDIIPALGHTHSYTAVEVEATCTKDAYTVYTCVKGDDTYTEIKENTALGHDMVTDAAVAPTCTQTGLTAGEHCSRCDEATVAQTVVDALGHDTVVDAAVAPTCTQTGLTEGSHCSRCDEATVAQTVVDALGHDIVIDAAVAPTLDSTGLTEGSHCSRCDDATVAQQVVPALEGVNVTLADTYASFGDVEGLDLGTTKVVKGSEVTLAAAPAGGCEFVGWQINKKIVSTDATYSFTAYTDVTVTPVFVDAEAAADRITVVFYDCYMNVTAAYTDVTVDEFQTAMAAGIPVGTTYAGKVFDGWTMSEDAIKALDHSATIEGIYTDAVNDGYTVTATDGATFEDGTTEKTGVKYDTEVTVSCEGATAWKINDVVVAYGSTYTFYVGSDVTVTPVKDESVAATPAVAMVSVDPVAGSHKVAFLATMSAADGYTIIDHGFVYGKDATQDELKLENVGKTIAASGTKVKSAALTVNSANQFALNYGVTAKTGSATAVAYITYKDASGKITTVYTNVADGTYKY